MDVPGSNAAPAAVKGFGDFNVDPYEANGRDIPVTPPRTPDQRVRNGRHVQARQEASSLDTTYTDWNNSEVAQAFKRSLPEGQKRGDRTQMAKARQDTKRASALAEKRKDGVDARKASKEQMALYYSTKREQSRDERNIDDHLRARAIPANPIRKKHKQTEHSQNMAVDANRRAQEAAATERRLRNR